MEILTRRMLFTELFGVQKLLTMVLEITPLYLVEGINPKRRQGMKTSSLYLEEKHRGIMEITTLKK